MTGVPQQELSKLSPYQRRRKLSRILAVQYVYCADSNQNWTLDVETLSDFRFLAIFGTRGEENDETILDEYENLGVEVNAAWTYATTLIRGVVENRQALDDSIREAALNWTLPRMTLADRAILRVGAYEIIAQPKGVTAATAINEAVELAKLFGESDSPKFINGVLDRIRRNTAPRPQKTEEN